MMINGHVYPQVDQHDWGTTFAERPLLFHNNHNGKFEYVPPVKGSGLATLTSGRGAAFGDLFNDGKIDVVINPIDGPPVLLRNVNPDHHHWVELKLVGGVNPANGKSSPRDAIGATVVSDSQRNSPARRCDERGQLHLFERSTRHTLAWGTRPMPGQRRFIGLRAQKSRSSCRRSIASTRSPKAKASPERCARGKPCDGKSASVKFVPAAAK